MKVKKRNTYADIDNKNELNQLIYPIKIFIMDVEKDGFPYIGIQFDCKWDQEHGVGVMLYKDNVVDIGGSDTAFMSWIAEEDKNRKKVRIEKIVNIRLTTITPYSLCYQSIQGQ